MGLACKAGWAVSAVLAAAALILATIQGLAMRWSLEARRFDLQAEGGRLIECLLAVAGPGGGSPR